MLEGWCLSLFVLDILQVVLVARPVVWFSSVSSLDFHFYLDKTVLMSFFLKTTACLRP